MKTQSEMTDKCQRCYQAILPTEMVPGTMPYEWANDVAKYVCRAGHRWKCSWRNTGEGYDYEQWRAV